MRNDGISMLEFIAHYLAIGFEHIYIFSNDNTDGTSDMLKLLAENDIVTYIDNPISTNTSPQRKAFEYSIHFLVDLRDFEWVFFADSDEFLIPSPKFGFNIGNVIDAVTQAYPENPPSAICYCWKWYGGHWFHRREGLQLEKYKYSGQNSTVKSLARLSDVRSMRPLHYPICKRKSFFVNSSFEAIETSQISKAPVNYDGGCVNHYWNKSFEEFSVKRARGDALEMNEAKNDYKRTDKQFFAWNTPASQSHYDPCPQEVIDLVRKECERLLQIPEIRSFNDEIMSCFPEFLRSIVDVNDLRSRFDDLTKQYPDRGFEV